MRYDLTDLRLFLGVVEAASITGGGARIGLAPASASARIRGMEEALGVALLERGRRGVAPTPAGLALAHHARLVVQQLERMRGELGAYGRGLRGHVRLLANTAALSEFLPEALADFLVAHPQVDLDLEERHSFEIVGAVAQGKAEIGIVADWAGLAGLESYPFRVDRLVLAVPRGDPLASRRRVGFAEVLERDFVGLDAGSALQDHLGRQALLAGRPLKLRVRLRGFEAVCRLVGRGVGLAVVPETAARRYRRAAAISVLRLDEPWAVRRLTLCLRDLAALPQHARALLEHLRAGAGELRPSGGRFGAR